MARVALTLVQFIIVLRYAAHGAAPAGDYFQLPLGWDIPSGNDDLQKAIYPGCLTAVELANAVVFLGA